MRRHFIMRYLLVGLVSLLIYGCYPAEDFFVDELDTAITFYDEDRDYSQYLTFAVPDSIVRIGDGDEDGEGQFDQLILDEIRSNLLALGYEEELDPENNVPDLVVPVELLIVDNTVVAPCYPFWPGWGWWYWPPTWGPGYCWGTPWVPVGQYTTGTIRIHMIDPSEADDSDETVPVVWNALINGLVTGSDSSIEARIRTEIDQSFSQSPYLGR